MDDQVPKSGSHYEDLEVEKGAPYSTRSFRGRAKDIFLAELYTEFIPRWYKKPSTKLPNQKTIANVAWVTTSLKVGAAVGSYALLVAGDFGDYAPIVAGVGIYLGADFLYQILDFRRTGPKKVRKAATLAVDIVSYPFYLISPKSRNARSARRGYSQREYNHQEEK